MYMHSWRARFLVARVINSLQTSEMASFHLFQFIFCNYSPLCECILSVYKIWLSSVWIGHRMWVGCCQATSQGSHQSQPQSFLYRRWSIVSAHCTFGEIRAFKLGLFHCNLSTEIHGIWVEKDNAWCDPSGVIPHSHFHSIHFLHCKLISPTTGMTMVLHVIFHK